MWSDAETQGRREVRCATGLQTSVLLRCSGWPPPPARFTSSSTGRRSKATTSRWPTASSARACSGSTVFASADFEPVYPSFLAAATLLFGGRHVLIQLPAGLRCRRGRWCRWYHLTLQLDVVASRGDMGRRDVRRAPAAC